MAAGGSQSCRKGCVWWWITLLLVSLVISAVVLSALHKKVSDQARTETANSSSYNVSAPMPAPEPSSSSQDGDEAPSPSSFDSYSVSRTPPAPPDESSASPPEPASESSLPVSKKYALALRNALTFFDVQKAGKLPKDNPIKWRGDSALNDGADVKANLSGGLYDAGDHIKFGLPMAFTASLLSWAVLEYGDHLDAAAKQRERASDAIRWITDYLINAHPDPSLLYIQVGDATVDHNCWERPEVMEESRPTLKIDTSNPGSDVAAETAAAMASASLVFRDIDPAYSKELLVHAENLFSFADNYRGLYSQSVPSVANYYNSSGFEDELLWAASWLYHATNDDKYLDYVSVKYGSAYAQWGAAPTWFSWDNKHAGVQVLLSRIHFFQSQKLDSGVKSSLKEYKNTADKIMCSFLPDSPSATGDRTTGGLLWITEWNPIQHAVGSALLTVIYSDYLKSSGSDQIQCGGQKFTANDLRIFASSQADYILGNNPMNISFLVGYSENYPKQVHHRGASIPGNTSTEYDCKSGMIWLHADAPNPSVAVGGVVGGPFKNESFIDFRENPMQNEPTTYNTAGLVGLLAGLVASSSAVRSFPL